MRRFFAAPAIAVLLWTTIVSAKLPAHPESVRPLYIESHMICTTWSVNEDKGIWMTAAHCIQGAADLQLGERVFTIGGEVANVIKADFVNDLAALRSATRAPALKLGKPPHVGDRVVIYGYPAIPGLKPVPVPVWAYVSVPYVKAADGNREHQMLLQTEAFNGHSGSPVIDSKGNVVGLWVGWHLLRAGNLEVAIPWAVLKHFAEDYWQ